MAKRACKGKTKKGTACRAAPLTDSDYCAAHDPAAPAGTRFGSPEQAALAGAKGGEARRVPKLTEVLAQKVEARAEEIIDTLLDALDADRGIVVGAGEDATLELTPDHRARIKAVEVVFDRLVGRPRQALELTGSGGGPVRISDAEFADPSVRAKLDAIVGAVGAARDAADRDSA